MLSFRTLLQIAGLCLSLAALPSLTFAAPLPEERASASAAETQAVELARAYQAGYLDVVGTACFQLYSSMGIVASDLSAGHITGSTALGALEQSALLLSVCQSSLDDIQALTSPDDPQGTELLARLDGMLAALGMLHSALVDAASAPRGDRPAQQAAVQAVENARRSVEAALDAYAKPL